MCHEIDVASNNAFSTRLMIGKKTRSSSTASTSPFALPDSDIEDSGRIDMMFHMANLLTMIPDEHVVTLHF
jgi:hypothetical protein